MQNSEPTHKTGPFAFVASVSIRAGKHCPTRPAAPGSDMKEYDMNDFFPWLRIKLNLEIVEQGVLFLFHHLKGGLGDLVQVFFP